MVNMLPSCFLVLETIVTYICALYLNIVRLGVPLPVLATKPVPRLRHKESFTCFSGERNSLFLLLNFEPSPQSTLTQCIITDFRCIEAMMSRLVNRQA